MKKLYIISILFLSYSKYGLCQSSQQYVTKEIHVQVPVDLPDLLKDSVSRKGDNYEYNITGQEIKDTNAFVIQPVESSDKSSPWMVLGELIQAYGTGKLDNIKALYTKASANQINSVLSSSDAVSKFLSMVKDVKTMHPYFAMDYDNGVIALVETNPGNVERFRFVKERGKYMLEAYQEKNLPQVNNVMAYYLYRPQPYLKPELVQSPDSLKSDESPFITFKLKNPGDWLSVFMAVPGYSVQLQEKDGDLNDYDNSPGIVKMVFYGTSFPIGNLDLMAVESSYPPNLITNSLINSGQKFTIKIKE